MLDPHPTCASQVITTRGLGRHYTSPRKPRDKKKSRMTMPVPGHASKQQKLLDKLHDLLAPPSEPKQPPCNTAMAMSPILQPEEPLEAHPTELEDLLVMSDSEDVSHGTTVQHICTTRPTARSISACAGWKALIPTIVDPFLKYTAATLCQPLVALGPHLSLCTLSCQEQKLTAILCLFFDR